MQEKYNIILQINIEKTVMTSESQIYKTHRFIKSTRGFLNLDIFLSKVAESIILNCKDIFIVEQKDVKDCFIVETIDKEHTFIVKLGYQTISQIGNKAIVFCAYINRGEAIRRNDRRLNNYLQKKTFSMRMYNSVFDIDSEDYKRLYNISNNDQIYFPMLSKEQQKIVLTEDCNVVVQGVAGSGKTNICISKIVFSAARAYAGKVLYTTFSRGLLTDTKNKIDAYLNNLISFVKDYDNGRIIFMDDNHKHAIENKLGIFFADDEALDIVEKVKAIIAFLQNKVDYYLLEDLYAMQYIRPTLATERYFVKEYAGNLLNHQLKGKLKQVEHLSKEVIYKEIYGMIFGCFNPVKPNDTLTLEEYIERRKDSFSKKECEIIYAIANDYYKHIEKYNLTDNNLISRKLLEKQRDIGLYSLAIIDEVQDMTEVSLFLLKQISRKLFCVGDAMQMINPTYFSFAYLKRLLYEKDIIRVIELSNNYRNTQKIVQIIDKLGSLNISYFGTHSFVLKGEAVDRGDDTKSIYVNDRTFIQAVAKENFYNITFVVADAKEKEALRKIIKKQEILTVSEIKGLERDTIILYNILSSNIEKWRAFERIFINRKSADENSVFRYYFNLLYVGISRAKSNIIVAEDKFVTVFKRFFEEEFERVSYLDAIDALDKVASKTETDEEELIERIEQFIKLEQYDNARFTANKLFDDAERIYRLNRIDIYQNYLHKGRVKEAGIRYWELGHTEEAKAQFEQSGDKVLSELVDACAKGESQQLGVDILDFFTEVEGNETARNLILQTLKNDFKNITDMQNKISNNFRRIKE